MKKLTGLKLVVGYVLLGLILLLGAVCLIGIAPFILAYRIGCQFKKFLVFLGSFLSDSAEFAKDHAAEIVDKLFDKYVSKHFD